MRSTLEQAREAAKAFFAALVATLGPSPADARRVLTEEELGDAVQAAHDALDLRLEALEGVTRARGVEALQVVARRTGDLRAELRSILQGQRVDEEGELSDLVRWIDVRSRSVSLGASPVDVGSTLRSRLFDRVPTVVCASATLATAGSFHFTRARLGVPPAADELLLESPFDFASRSAFYVPGDLPEPTDPAWEPMAVDRIVELVRMTGGGAFVLCTSSRAMRSIHARLRGKITLPLLLQGERPKHMLLARFRASENAVLVATMSFWEGVDVPGWALRLVILDKIPFAPPNDPVVAARCERLDREGGNGFSQYSVPSAGMTLKQGFGRLIRSQRDAGIVALLDRRAARKGYGRALLASLPPARRVGSLEQLRAFWEAIARGRAGSSLEQRAGASPLDADRGRKRIGS